MGSAPTKGPRRAGLFAFWIWRPARAISRFADMDTYESQFRAIVGHNHTPSRELDADQARALTALIFQMPETEVVRDGEFLEYSGWSAEQNVYLAVTVSDDHAYGAEAVCFALNQVTD